MKKLLTEKDLKGLLAKEYCRKSNESEDKQTHSLEDQHLANRKSIERVRSDRKVSVDPLQDQEARKKILSELMQDAANSNKVVYIYIQFK